MTDKTEAQPEALRLAAWLNEGAWHQMRLGDVLAAGREMRRQHAEIQRLRALAATCYAGLGGECDLPVIWLDALNDAANGEPFDTDGLLPYTSAIRAQLTVQTNRAAAAEQQVTAFTQRLDMANRLNTDARNQLAQLSARQAAPDGWRLVPELPTLNMLNTAFGICTDNGRPVQQMIEAAAGKYAAMLSAAPHPPEREPLTELQKQALAVYLPPFQFSYGYVFDSAGRMVADEGREHELDQLASTVGVRIRGWGHLGKLKNGAEVQDTIGELAAAALNAFWKQHGIGATND
jgi:hypothetical protein